jgi:hypothetical protein
VPGARGMSVGIGTWSAHNYFEEYG